MRKNIYGFDQLKPGDYTMIRYIGTDREKFTLKVHNAVNSWRRRGYAMHVERTSIGVLVEMRGKTESEL